MRILLAQINPVVGDIKGNGAKILQSIQLARESDADIVVFSELALCGYPPDDLLLHPDFIQTLDRTLTTIVEASKNLVVILGTVRCHSRKEGKPLFNTAAIIHDELLLGFQDKTLLPTYDVFDERRYFEPASERLVWNLKGKKIAITLCEDIWHHSNLEKESHYNLDPIEQYIPQSPDLLINLSASPFKQKKCHIRLEVCKKAAVALQCPVLLCNQVGGNDSLIFDGYSLYHDAQGNLLAHAKGFEEDHLLVDLDKESKPIFLKTHQPEDLYKALVLGVRDYFTKLNFEKACIGISGGIDSAVVACIAKEALRPENVTGIMMPSPFSSASSLSDGDLLIKNLNIHGKTISIEQPFECFLNTMEPYFRNLNFDKTEENMQARIRGLILMAYSNKFGSLVLSTGNKSEMAMGYATLYGDMCGSLSVIGDVSKTEVYALAHWINRKEEIIPESIIRKPPSAELRPNQLDSDTLPDYQIIDNVLAAYIEEHMPPEKILERYGYPLELIKDLIKKIHLSEFKRRQSAPSLKVTSRSFSVGRRFPIVQRWV